MFWHDTSEGGTFFIFVGLHCVFECAVYLFHAFTKVNSRSKDYSRGEVLQWLGVLVSMLGTVSVNEVGEVRQVLARSPDGGLQGVQQVLGLLGRGLVLLRAGSRWSAGRVFCVLARYVRRWHFLHFRWAALCI